MLVNLTVSSIAGTPLFLAALDELNTNPEVLIVPPDVLKAAVPEVKPNVTVPVAAKLAAATEATVALAANNGLNIPDPVTLNVYAALVKKGAPDIDPEVNDAEVTIFDELAEIVLFPIADAILVVGAQNILVNDVLAVLYGDDPEAI